MRRSSLSSIVLVAATLIALVAIFGYIRQNTGQIQSLLDDTNLVAHTLEVQRRLDDVLLALAEAEAAQRGYLVTASSQELTRFSEAQRRAESAMTGVVSLTQDHPSQQSRSLRLQETARAKLAGLAGAIEEEQAHPREKGLAKLSIASDRQATDAVRQVVLEMIDEEGKLLAVRRDRANEAYERAVRGRVGSGIVSAALLVGLTALAIGQARIRGRATEQIAQEREHLRVTLRSIGDGVIATDTSGRITLMNPVASQLTGWPAAEALNKQVADVFHVREETTGARVESPIERVLRERTDSDVAQRAVLVARDGTARPIDDTAAQLRTGDMALRGAVLVFRDVTTQRAQEEALKEGERRYRETAALEQSARADAETANRIKDEFLAVLSHELRTPLNAVLGWTQILQAGAADPPAVQRALASIKRNAEAQQRLVEDLLDVSRIVTGKFALEMKPFELSTAVAAAVDGIRPAAAVKGVELHANLNGAILVLGDPYRIQQVVSNLLSNALKFTPSSGRIMLAVSAGGASVSLTVQDTGQGIESALLPHIFDRFRQGDASSTRSFGGLGLGLAIVRHIVAAHGGSIAAESEGRGRGAAFIVQLPVIEATETMAATVGRRDFSSPRRTLTGLSALVVDDEEDSRDLLAYALDEAGAQVQVAATGEEALRALDQSRPDVILTDVQMPEMDGFALLRAVQTRLGMQAPPTIAITARARTDDAARAAEAGFFTHVTKPVDLELLVFTIHSAIRGTALES